MLDKFLGYVRRHHVALLALFISLGGVSYAATQLPKNSVGSKQLKKNAVTAKKIRKNAVNSKKVKDRSLLARDFKPGQLPQGPRGETGPAGPPGPLLPEIPGQVLNKRGGSVIISKNMTSYTPLLDAKVTLDAPKDGYVLAMVSAHFYPFVATVVGTCAPEVAIRHGDRISSSRLAHFTTGETDKTFRAVTVVDTLPVTKGENLFEVVRRNNPSIGDTCDSAIMISGTNLNILWVPKGESAWD